MIASKDYAHARQELERDTTQSEKLGLKLVSARIHYLLGDVLSQAGNSSEASGHYQQAITILDGLKVEAGAEHLLDRPDLHSMYSESQRRTSKS